MIRLDIKKHQKGILPPMLLLSGGVVLWELVTRFGDVPNYLFPPPAAVLNYIQIHWPGLATDIFITLGQAMCGLLLAVVVGIVFSVIFVNSVVWERALMPIFVAFQAVPIIAIAPLLVIWFGNGIQSKVVMAALISFFPIVVNLSAGLKSPKKDMLDLMLIMGSNRWEILWKLRIPMALPFFFSGLKIAGALSFIGSIVAELAGAKAGIGFRIIISSYRTDITAMFASIILASIVGYLIYFCIHYIENRSLFWRKYENH